MIKQVKQMAFVHGEHYDITGTISPDRSTQAGETLQGVRKFLYGDSNVALNISFQVNDKVGSRNIVRYMDAICFREDQFPAILKLKLKEGDDVAVFGRCSYKSNGNGFSFVVEEAGWISKPSKI